MKVSVICASPSTFNAGMEAVDKAWDVFVERYELAIEYQKYRFDKISYNGGKDSGYLCITEHYSNILASDLIIYWGDFLHMNHYIKRKAYQLYKANHFESEEEALNFVQKILLLKGESIQTLKKVISFGTNQLLENSNEKFDPLHFESVQRLINNSKAWLPRDLFSAHHARLIRNEKNNLTQGVDCALLAWDNLSRNNYKLKKIGKIGCFYGRSSSRYLKLNKFARRINKQYNADIIWIPWINREDQGIRNRYKQKIFSHKINKASKEYFSNFENISWLSSFDLIITDTYHLAVNSWAAGTPTIMIAETVSTQRSSGAEFSWNDKRFMFYQMIDALDFFVHSKELDKLKTIEKRIKHLMSCLKNEKLINWIQDRISIQVELAEKTLLSAIKEN